MKLSYSDKEYYLDANNTKLTDNKFLSLPKDLKKKYINQFTDISDIQFESIKKDKDLLNRYIELVNRKFENLSKRNYSPNITQISYGEYSVLDSKFKPKINEEILKYTKFFLKDFLYDIYKYKETINTSNIFKNIIEYVYYLALWKEPKEYTYSKSIINFIPHFGRSLNFFKIPNFSILSAAGDDLKREFYLELDKNQYDEKYIGIYLYLAKELDKFNNYLNF